MIEILLVLKIQTNKQLQLIPLDAIGNDLQINGKNVAVTKNDLSVKDNV